MAVTGIDGRLYKDQASADKAAARIANAPDISGMSGTQNTTPTTKTTTSTTPEATTPTKKTTTTSGNGWGESNYKDTDGYYSATERNAATGGAEFGTSPTKTTTTSTPTTSAQDVASKVRDAWDGLDYETQQDMLKKNPALKNSLAKYGATNKTEPTKAETPAKTETTTTGARNPDGTNWDYQDNSPERMLQMADNVNRLAVTNPDIFTSEDAFRNFFIDGKGRTPEQEQFLMDFYRNRQIYNKFDGYPADKVGSMYAYGQVPDSYLNYLKNTNPDRYNEIMDYKDKTEDSIADESYYSDLLKNSGFEDSSNLRWQVVEGLLVDENGDLIDDRRYHEMSKEERAYRDEINSLQADNLKLEETIRYLDSDLIEQYPDADYSTIMLLRSDRGSKIQRQIDANNVTLTKLQGTVNYLQSERQQQDKAGADTIAQLQKNLGMYYEYSPQGMQEIAEAQYEIANPSLESAETGTDTQKRMALESALSGYYEQYGSIIERPMSQVISDVMNYAKKNGVSLSQALKENFVSKLKAKPEYETLSKGTPKVSFEKVGDTGYILTVNPDGTYSYEVIGGGKGYNGGAASNGYSFTNYTPITSQELKSGIDNFVAQHPEKSDGGQCGSFVNDYLESLGYDRLYTDPVDKKKAITNTDTPVKGAVAVMDSKNYPEYGHTAIVLDVKGEKVQLLESNWNDDEKVHTRRVDKKDVYGYFDPSKAATSTKDILNNKFEGDPDWNQNGYYNGLVPYFNSLIKDGKIDLTDTKYKEKLKDYGITDKEFDQMAQNYANTELKTSGAELASRALEYAIKTYDYLYGDNSTQVGWGPMGTGSTEFSNWLGRNALALIPTTNQEKAKTEFNSMIDRLTLQELFNAKALGATFGAMSKDEWDVLKNAATDVKRGAGNFKENMEDLIESLYTASIDGKAELPWNWNGSASQNMVYDRIQNGRARGNYKNYSMDELHLTKEEDADPSYLGGVSQQDKYDNEFNG